MRAAKTPESRSAAIISSILILPTFAFLVISVFQIEPLDRMLKDWSTLPDGRQSPVSLVLLASLPFLAMVATVISLMSVRGTVRSGRKMLADPVNLVIAITGIAFLVAVAGVVIFDQLPCSLGRSNCD